MLNTVMPLLYQPNCTHATKWSHAYAMAHNRVWWDAIYAWCGCDSQLLERQWQQHGGSQHTWFTRCMFSRYPNGGIWDWHCDQDVILISRGSADNHATRTVHAVIRGSVEIQTMDETFSLPPGYGVQFASTNMYTITTTPGTQCVSVWGMYPFKHYPKPQPVAKYKKKHNREI